jgi:alpha-D-xyloside xylohydrolase
MRAEVTKSSGTIRFLGAENQLLLEEPATNGRYTSPVVRRSDTASHLWQKFVLNHGEALYGLGQHQNAPMNYRNSSLTLLQSNRVENGVPLLVSTNGYGIFWDNASETMFASGTATAFEGIAPTQLFTANGTTGGLTGEYYASNNFTNLVLTRDDKGIDFDWWKLSPAAGMPNDNYSIRWTGKILTEAAGTYTFRSLEDDGLRVWVNNTLLINDWATHPLTNKEGSISLAANTKYNITVEYFEATDKSLVRLEWKKPSSANTAFSFYSDIGDQIDYYMIYGPEIDQIVAGYQAVTGSVPLLPKWSYGFFQSRERYIDQNMVLTIANEFRTRKIPIDVIVQDWNYWTAWNSFIFDASRYPDPAGIP